MLFVGLGAVAVAVVVLIVVMLTSGDDDGGEVATTAPVTTAPPATDGSTAPATTAPPTTAPATTVPPTTAPPTTTLDPASPEALAASVVQIQLLLGDQSVCTGSGTILSEDGLVLTNSHVITQSRFCPHDRIGVAVAERSDMVPELAFEADLLVDDPDLDLAVIRLARTIDGAPASAGFVPLPVGDSDGVALGDRLRVVGYPGIGGETVTFTEGSVSGFVATPEAGERSWFKTDATIAGGNSGGLAANDAGEIVGVPTRAGSGSGQIVDCRPVTDTNGDGAIDQNDSCVPIGGFINGIRPVALALPLLEAARTASPIDQGPPPVDAPMDTERPRASAGVWTLGVDQNGFPAQPVLVAPDGATELCLTWQYDAVPVGSSFDAVWLVDGVRDEGASFLGGTTTDGPSGSFFACISNPGGLAPGVYELAWIVEGEAVFADATFVGGQRSAVTVRIQNDSPTALCLVQFNPSGTLSYGLNDLSEPIPAGGSFDLALGSGRYDARIIDCDGATLIEDATGTDITSDVTLTLP